KKKKVFISSQLDLNNNYSFIRHQASVAVICLKRRKSNLSKENQVFKSRPSYTFKLQKLNQ
ncbi:hypothetical protein KSS87_017263, partial [Heliosperma pusillum]